MDAFPWAALGLAVAAAVFNWVRLRKARRRLGMYERHYGIIVIPWRPWESDGNGGDGGCS
jgi:hypothetical protein